MAVTTSCEAAARHSVAKVCRCGLVNRCTPLQVYDNKDVVFSIFQGGILW